MREFGIIYLVLTASQLLTMAYDTSDVREACPNVGRVNLTGEILDPLETVNKWGYEFPPESRWIEENGNIFGCSCYTKPCLPLCCPLGFYGKDKNDRDCNPVEDASSADTFLSIYSVNETFKGDEANDNTFRMIVADPNCSYEYYSMKPNELRDVYYLLNNGSLYLPNDNVFIYFVTSYCLWRTKNSLIYFPKVCAEFNQYETHPGPNLAVRIGTMISIPFLVFTFIIYTILPKLRTIHGLIMRGYVGCFIVAYVTKSLLVEYLIDKNIPCQIPAYIMLFSFYGSFFWLNVMSFDLWWNLGCSRFRNKSINQSNRKKSFIFSGYSWGCAILFTSICAIMDKVPGIEDPMLRPDFAGKKICWFGNYKSRAFYFYGPLGTTFFANTIFFILTAKTLIQHANDNTRCLRSTESARHNDNKHKFVLYFKLFIAMGIMWIIQVLAPFYEDIPYFWWIMDFISSLHGLIIFVCFVCKKKILRQLLLRFSYQESDSLARNSTRNTRQNSKPETFLTSADQEN